MPLQSWWENAVPHMDIISGRLEQSVFAASLGDVVYGEAPKEYRDARVFSRTTYWTHGLRGLIKNVFRRLSGEGGDSVIQLQTPFGGGKTHALLALYHAVKNWEIVSQVPEIREEGISLFTKAKVAVFVGTHMDALSGRTPWGEIAEQLGQYDVVKEHDKKRVAPGKERIRQMLESAGPTLILIDEILEYIVKANRVEKEEKITHGQTLAFLQEISETVASSRNCCLVITLPASVLETYDEEAEKALQQLQKVSGRVEAIYTPVEGIELYEVIRKRLFEHLGDEEIRRKVIRSYFTLYQKLGVDAPPEVKEADYRERMERAYPFHPELIDVLHERWGSYPTFQRTRGVLRLLAEIVSDLYKRKIPCPLIQSSLVNLENQAIRQEFVKHIGNEYESVIAADIAGKDAKSQKIDSDMGSEYKKYGIAQGIATSVFIYSFSAGKSQETTIPRIRVALLREGIPTTIVDNAVAKLEDELWFFHSEKKRYAFRKRPNLNRVIVDREENFSSREVQEELKRILEKHSGRAMEVYLWPERESDIPDNKNLKLAILANDLPFSSDKAKLSAVNLLEKAGIGFRVYRNTLFVLLIDENQAISLNKAVRRALALRELQTSKFLQETLTRESQEDLKKRLVEIEKELPFRLLTAYRHLAMLSENGKVVWKDLG
ncbi:MAG: DUF499 domain-containing protein, partial [Planctomycetota bacterium]|nr:DUF499 domain-containing protein [Planctomycetota bacterium]